MALGLNCKPRRVSGRSKLDFLETNSLPDCLGCMKVQKGVVEEYGLPVI